MTSRPQRSSAILATVFITALLIPDELPAADLASDPTAPNMQSVNDVLNGKRTLLRQDDLAVTLWYKQPNSTSGGAYSNLIALRTNNSHISPNPQIVGVSTSDIDFPEGIQASSGIGRMYNNTYDVVITMTQATSANPSPLWTARFWDPVSGNNSPIPISSQFGPYGQVYSQVVMGDFNGDGLSEALLFYCSVEGGQKIDWAMTVLTAQDINTVGSIRQGPQFYTHAPMGVTVPVTGSIVTGDFDGNGMDEIAALFTDNQTIQFYTVDGKSILAQVAPIFNWAQGYSEQLVLGLQYNTAPTGIVWIASFDSAFNFKLAGWTDVEGERGCLLGMQTGNFNNQTNGQINPNLQIALFELEGSLSSCNPPFHNGNLKVKIVNINAPDGIQPDNPPSRRQTGSWMLMSRS